MDAATLHLICGSTGAGKTTYAIKLADELGAARFSIDEWMSQLFWMDAAQPIDPGWAADRVGRCAALMWRTAVDVARRGTPCVLESGLTMQAERARYAALAKADGVTIELHFLDVPADERWRRVAARNRIPQGDGQLPFQVTREMFDFVEAMWEPPSADELASCKLVAHDATAGRSGGADMPITITTLRNGPLKLSGDLAELRLVDADGAPHDVAGKRSIFLCRCGASTTKPFCDGQHSKIGFQAAEAAVSAEAGGPAGA